MIIVALVEAGEETNIVSDVKALQYTVIFLDADVCRTLLDEGARIHDRPAFVAELRWMFLGSHLAFERVHEVIHTSNSIVELAKRIIETFRITGGAIGNE